MYLAHSRSSGNIISSSPLLENTTEPIPGCEPPSQGRTKAELSYFLRSTLAFLLDPVQSITLPGATSNQKSDKSDVHVSR